MKRSVYTREEKIQIVRDYLSNNLSSKEMCEKYGLTNPNIFNVWKFRYLKSAESLDNSEKSCTFAVPKPAISGQVAETEMKKEKTKEELEQELSQTQKDLEWANLQILALNKLIDIAEREGIKIRKKSGAKQ